MELVTIGPVAGDAAALEREARAAISSLTTTPALAILYCPIDVDPEPCARALRAATGLPLVGATTGGAAFTERGASQSGVCAGLLAGDNLDIVTSLARDLRRDPEASVRAALAPILDRIDKRRKDPLSLMVLADAFATDGEVLLDAIRKASPLHFRVFGGTAGDGWTFKGTKVFSNDEVASDAAILIGPFTGVPFQATARHGFSAAAGAREFEITAIEGNILRSLDCSPAARVYRDELRRLGLLSPGDDLVKVMARHELGARTPFREELKIRAPLGASDDGAVTLASSLPPRSLVRVVSSSPDRLIQAAREVAQRVSRKIAGGAPRGALVFDCAARLQLLADRYGEAVAAFRGGGDHPILGMACYGELLRVGGTVDGFHNTTAILAAF